MVRHRFIAKNIVNLANVSCLDSILQLYYPALSPYSYRWENSNQNRGGASINCQVLLTPSSGTPGDFCRMVLKSSWVCQWRAGFKIIWQLISAPSLLCYEAICQPFNSLWTSNTTNVIIKNFNILPPNYLFKLAISIYHIKPFFLVSSKQTNMSHCSYNYLLLLFTNKHGTVDSRYLLNKRRQSSSLVQLEKATINKNHYIVTQIHISQKTVLDQFVRIHV